MNPPADSTPLLEPDAVDAALYGLPVRAPDSANLIRDPVELAASDFLEELRQGFKPSLEVYLQRYPQHAARLREILPLVAAMESWKIRQDLANAQASTEQPLPIQRLGDYRLVREIGKGGMGVVYEAVEPSGRHVAVKLLSGRFPAASFLRKRFYGEAQTVAQLRHHHIIPVYSFGEQDGWCYFSMQLIEGLGLDRVIRLLREPSGAVSADDIRRLFAQPVRRDGSTASEQAAGADRAGLPSATVDRSATDDAFAQSSDRVLRRDSWWQVAKIGMQVAATLRYAHGCGILHRDIKPANLLLDSSGSVWVADFGVASKKKLLRDSGDNHVAGTLRYIAPEQLYGAGDERSDVYSLGVTLYELCTLRPAFDALERDALIKQVIRSRPRKPRAINRRVPVELERIIVKAMSSDLSRRYQSADELLTALRPLVRQRPAGWLDRLLPGG